MASGHLCLNLSEQVEWEAFPAYAEQLLRVLRGRKVESLSSVDIRIWDLLLHGTRVRLVFDDFPVMVSLESSDDEGDAVLRRVEAQLIDMRKS
jgi:hypothetical protein